MCAACMSSGSSSSTCVLVCMCCKRVQLSHHSMTNNCITVRTCNTATFLWESGCQQYKCKPACVCVRVLNNCFMQSSAVVFCFAFFAFFAVLTIFVVVRLLLLYYSGALSLVSSTLTHWLALVLIACYDCINNCPSLCCCTLCPALPEQQ